MATSTSTSTRPRSVDTDVFDYDGATFRHVKDTAFSGPYDVLPHHRGLGPTTFLRFFNDSSRNLFDKRDIRPYFDKLIHSNGICYAGTWRITRPTPYTGYFAEGAEGLLLARLSVAGPATTRGNRRAFGIAGKIFPTLDPDAKVMPGNFVTVSGLSGSRAKHVLDIDATNRPVVGLDPAANLINRVIFRMVDTRPGYRQLFPVAALGLKPGDPVATPSLILFRPAEGTPRVDADDFRDELRLSNYPAHTLTYTINVRNFDEPNWSRIGEMVFTEDAVSEGGDKRLHFWIPRDIPSPGFAP
jgi:hypothetical protein